LFFVTVAICAIAMLAFTALAWVAMRHAPPHTTRFCPEAGAREAAILFGAAIGLLAGFPADSHGPWIATGGIASIPIGAGALALGWQLLRSNEPIREPSLIVAGVTILAWVILLGAVLSGGLALAEGAAVCLAIGAWAWFRSGADHARGKVARPIGGVAVGILAIGLCGWIGAWMGVAPRIVWTIACIGLVGLVVIWGAADCTRDVRPAMAVAVFTPLTALGAATVIRIVTLGVVSGIEARRSGASWIMGFAEMLAARPVAPVPGGLVPEVCLAGAVVGAGLCASKLPVVAQRLLGLIIGLGGAGIVALALGF